MIPFSRFILEAVATRPKKPSRLARQRKTSSEKVKKAFKTEREGMSSVFGGLQLDTTPTYIDFGHPESPYEKEDQKAIEALRQKVWGVKQGSRLPDLWVVTPHIEPSKGMKYVTIRTLENPRDTHSDVFPETARIWVGTLPNDEPQMQGRVDHNRKVISATSLHYRGGSRYSSRTVDAIFAELKKRYPGYQIVDMIDEGNIVRFGRFLRERKHFLPRYRHEDHRN